MITTSPGAVIGADTDTLPARFLVPRGEGPAAMRSLRGSSKEPAMTPAPQIPSHIRFMIAGIQDRAMDLALLGHTGVKVELDIGDTYAVFELVTRPKHCDGDQPERRRITAQLACVMGLASYMPLAEALADARQQMAAMLDHLNALIGKDATCDSSSTC